MHYKNNKDLVGIFFQEPYGVPNPDDYTFKILFKF